MEEKESIKQKIFIALLMIIAIILILCIVFYIFKDTKEEKNTVIDDEIKITNEINDNIINENNNENNNTVNEINDENNMLDEESEENKIVDFEVNVVEDIKNMTTEEIENIAKSTLTEYLKIEPYEKSSIGPMPYLLSRLGLATEKELDSIIDSNQFFETSEYIKSNVNYDEFKNALLKFITEDYFIRFFSQYRNIDDYVAFCNCAGGGFWFSIENVELISNKDNKYIFDVTMRDLEIYNHYLEDKENYTEGEYDFIVKVEFEYIDDRLVISEYNYQIILEGVYAMEASDVAYEFYEDGTVEYSTNMSVLSGSYIMSGENEIKITWEKETVWDSITSEETTKKASGTETLMVMNNNTVGIEFDDNGEKYINEFVRR